MKNAIKVLIVDDDKASAQALSEVVKRSGFKPVVQTKPVDALNVVRLQTVHAAIVDVLLPKMTGVELVNEFRKTKFGDAPVIFVSGVFRDKTFAAETMKKTGAVEFLFKPFDNDEITQSLNRSMQSLISSERWSVQSLLTRKLSTDRERSKAIENLEQIKGLDFPFILSILMEVGTSGHLNIVNDAGEIFGVSLAKGTISEVDSTESQSTGVLALISKGFLSQEDWEEFQKSGSRKFSLEKLVQEGYVSPHAISDARKEQILYDFRAICSAQSLQINFVAQEDNEEPPKHAVKLHDLMELLLGSLDEFFPQDYLTELYQSILGAPIQVVGEPADLASVWASDAFKGLDALKAAVENGGTAQQALAGSPDDQTRIYQCLHYLIMNRTIIFDDINRAKNLQSMLERFNKLYAEIKDKTPDKIFEYFGANANAPANVISSIYDEFARSNNPDILGKDATPELRELCKKCFELVTKAKEVLTDETSKQNLFSELKARAAEGHKAAQLLMNAGFELLRAGQAAEALEKLQKSEALFPGARVSFLSAWAEIKAGGEQVNKQRLQALTAKLDGATSDEKKSQYYFMAMGLIKKRLGDLATATAMFEKAMQADDSFVEPRRELMKLQAEAAKRSEKKKSESIFTGDITTVVSQIFRRKAE